MKPTKSLKVLSWPGSSFLLALLFGLATASTHAAPVIGPTGANYTGVSANSSFNDSYGPNNLFNFNVASASPGTALSDTAEWATAGVLTGYVAFQLDTVYAVSSLYFAQRDSGGRPDTDQMNLASLWVSQSTPFDPNNPPQTTPDSQIVLSSADGTRAWAEYPLSGTITGQFFLVEFVQTNGNCCNPGGSELRLGGMVPSIQVPTLSQMPSNHTLFSGGTARFSVVADDGNTAPMTYQWYKGSTALNDNSRIIGATAPNLVIANLAVSDNGNYSCTVTNVAGKATSTAATLTVLTAPTSGVAGLIWSNNPYAYWRFDESAGATVASDFAGGFDAAYGVDSSLGNPGPQSPAFPGFSATNAALGTILGDPTSVVTVPPLNLNTNALTIIAWIKPTGIQDQYASLIVWRGSAAYGLLAYQPSPGKPNTLSYIWRDYGWYEDSGLPIPTDQWSMAAMVVSSSNVTLYLGANGAVNNYVSPNSNTNLPGAFDSSMYIGCDSLSRVFNGQIDDVAFFASSLTAQQIQEIYAAGVGQVPVSISEQPVSRTNYAGGTARFSIIASGSSPQYQWKKGSTPLSDGGNISGSHTPSLTIVNIAAADAGNYSCTVSNSLGSPQTSSPATLTVIPAPTTGYDAAILTYKPLAYWQLNEAQGAGTAVDYWGGFDGTYLPNASLGNIGPQSPEFPGFTSTNTALLTTAGDGNSTIAVPALNLNANTATILMWVKPSGLQGAYASLFANRSGGYATLNYNADGATLSFQWDVFGWDSGVLVPSDQWSLIGMVIAPTSTTVYLGTGGELTNSTDVLDNPALSFAGTSYIGCDSGNNTRVFNGLIDDVAFFNRSLSTSDIANIYNAALGQFVPPTTLNWSVSSAGLTLTWSTPWNLYQADVLTGPWTPATSVVSGTPIPITAAKKFYRLQR